MPVIRAEIVSDHRGLTTGLMGRKHLPKGAGMLFDFGKDQPLAFWMKNTYIPLQIAFISSRGVVEHIASMAPLSTRSVRSPKECRYALEVNEGWFEEHNVRVGATVAVPSMGDQQSPQPPGGEQQGQPSPDVTIQQSYKDILKAANDFGVSLMVEYITKDGASLPPKQVSPPFEFGDTAEGDSNGLVTVWDDQRARYTSLIVANIVGLKDTRGNPVTNVDGVKAVFTATPNRVVDEFSSRGKVPGVEQTPAAA